MLSSFGVASYGVAALAYGALTVILLVSHPGSRRATWLLAATAATTLWASLVAVLSLEVQPGYVRLFLALDALHSFVWTACVLAWLATAASTRRLGLADWLRIASGGVGLWIVLLAAAAAPQSAALARTAYPAMLVMTLVGLLAAEQVFRNAPETPRKAAALLSLAVGGMFVVDLFAYSHATLVGGLTPGVWQSRGLANAVLVPFLLLATKRQPDWERDLFVSRQVVFYTASIMGVGGYLLTMGVVAYAIRGLGGQWALGLQAVFLLGAFGLLLVVLLSSGIKAHLKVLLLKHFFRDKYDYREEWLRLTETLGHTGELRALAASALRGIARIVSSRRGGLWLAREAGSYEPIAALGSDGDAPEIPKTTYAASHPLVAFLAEHCWVVDAEEYAEAPDRYRSAFGHPESGLVPRDTVVVPLDCRGALLGFVVLARPGSLGSLNFEDYDLLKTAGRQVAAVLAQALAQEQLSETRQFEAMNKLSVFLMHDLKNVVAQQELIVANADRFRDRPEFFDDAIRTVRSSVERMKGVIEQLQGVARGEAPHRRADVTRVLRQIENRMTNRQPVPEVEGLPDGALWVAMDAEALGNVLAHLIRNSQEATPPDGSIRIGVAEAGDDLVITITDTGCGMDAEFVRYRLFKPFESTKGAEGMGIGAFQARDALRAAGGDVEVASAPGQGTTFTLRVPFAGPRAARPEADEPAARMGA